MTPTSSTSSRPGPPIRQTRPAAKARDDQTQLLTPQDLSDLLGIPVRTLADWRSARKGPLPLRIGVHVRYRISDVETWLETRARAAQDWMAS